MLFKRLMSRPKPIIDESRIGYMIRLCEDNSIEMSYLFEIIEYDKVNYSNTLADQFDSRVSLYEEKPLSEFTK
ncbi:hypothetical protein GC096_11875 [Paenibacillus sp. LMG 31461]|uniref:Uncharacterized protein n=1 Tax=Paenibacillus plantarum TaxID=2654975 RepID=A0ABX1X9I0_9BACL|nr:hypothetical protein [Paenibacillus plantarum]NOU64726.1 hypothetical protein [Paenibacillus plantarum]